MKKVVRGVHDEFAIEPAAPQLEREIGHRKLVDHDQLGSVEAAQPRRTQAVLHCPGGKPVLVLHPRETLLGHRRDDATTDHHAGGGVVGRVDAQDGWARVHLVDSVLLRLAVHLHPHRAAAGG
jgi:hypothetical protein